jgi:tryptophan 2,3-dioxygenase
MVANVVDGRADSMIGTPTAMARRDAGLYWNIARNFRAMTSRPLEPGIVTDLEGQLTYGSYLRLDRLLSSQESRSTDASGAPLHDEMLFIIQHQTSELWMKLLIHELKAAIRHVKADRLQPNFKILARVKQIQRQLFEQWAVLETLTPSEYDALRPSLASSSGFQSAQYRAIEFLLGNKNAAMLDVFRHDPDAHAGLFALLHAPSLYDEFIRHLARRGLPVPDACLARDVTEPHVRDPGLTQVFKAIYEDPVKWWDAYDMCEKLVDVEESFQLWRFRHMKTVERIIGSKRGTGGSSGVNYLRGVLDVVFFPELIDVRSLIGTPAPNSP